MNRSLLPPSRESLKKMLALAKINLSDEAVTKLWRYHNLLRQRNQDRDLTRLIGFHTIVLKHYIDSMIIGSFYQLKSPLVDIGTGAGFPGIPLKIRYPELNLILAEPRPRRIEFLKEACQLLQFKNYQVFEHKVVSQSFQVPVRGIITRALETMDKTILRTTGCAEPGTEYYFLKGPNCDQEIEEVLKRFKSQVKLEFQKDYVLPQSPQDKRRFLVFKRI